MNILLTGATGFIGDSVLRALLQAGHCVSACCRQPERLLSQSDLLTPVRIDFATADTEAAWLPHLDGIDAIINCVGIIGETKNQTFAQLHSAAPIALFNAGIQAGVGKIIQVSALGADAQAESVYHLSKRAADDALRALPVAWFVLQPSVVYGDRASSSVLFHALAALPVHVLPDGGGQELQPVHVDDLVAVILRCLEPATPSNTTLAVVGPEAIPYKTLLQKLRRRLGKGTAFSFSLPQPYVLMAASFGKYLGEPILSKDNIAMLSRGNTASPEAITSLLGRPPVSMVKQLFEKIATDAERWQAQLYFFKPALHFAIALVWLWSGIVSLFYPLDLSYQLLDSIGGDRSWAAFLQYGLAALDIGLGVLTLAAYRQQNVLSVQIAVVVAYTLVVGLALPQFWLHPFGPLLKNLPFLLSLLIYKQLLGGKA